MDGIFFLTILLLLKRLVFFFSIVVVGMQSSNLKTMPWIMNQNMRTQNSLLDRSGTCFIVVCRRVLGVKDIDGGLHSGPAPQIGFQT